MASPLLLTLKRMLFLTLNRLLNPNGTETKIANSDDERGEYIWLFCSTIGELNACKPLIEHIYAKHQIVLITDRAIYQDSYLAAFPNATFVQLGTNLHNMLQLVQRLPPRKVILCEIPVLLHDAPCRLPFELLYQAKAAGAGLYLVNGWLYRESPSCRQDQLEKTLFERDYLALFDAICVQTEQVRHALLAAHPGLSTVHVTGNMKFDAINTDFTLKSEIAKNLLALYESDPSRVFVAGCLASKEDYERGLDIYQAALESGMDVKLVLVPRHPENAQHMDTIKALLEKRGLAAVWRSEIRNVERAPDILILNTIGELKAFYSVADVSYVGRNHNLLEPLAFGKTVLASGHWKTAYPSYPVFQVCLEHELIIYHRDVIKLISQVKGRIAQVSHEHKISSSKGATKSNLAIIEDYRPTS